MSLQRLKAAFETTAAAKLSREERDELWLGIVKYLIADCPGETLRVHVPTRIKNINLRRIQGELFAALPLREAARELGCSASTVGRDRKVCQSSPVSATAA